MTILFISGIILLHINRSEYNGIAMEVFPIDICCNENGIYFVGKKTYNLKNTYSLYKVDKNDYSIENMYLPILTENIVIRNITSWNRDLYLVVNYLDDNCRYEIWKVNNENEAVCTYEMPIDVSKNGIREFCIDKNGIYYFRCANKAETILIEQSSGTIIHIPDNSEDVSFESMTIGTNGNIFALFCKNVKAGGGYEIIEFVNKKMDIIYSGNLLPYNDIYSVMGSGNNEYDLFIKGSKSVYGFSKDRKEAEYINELLLDEYQYTKSCFMDGKQLLIFCMNPQNENKKKINYARLLLLDLQKREVIK